VLGAVTCTTDAIAVGAIAKRIGLPEFLLEIIEGESLLNDATGLLALEFSVALVVSGTIPTVAHGIGQLLFLVVGGIIAGVIVGWIVAAFQRPVQGAALQTMVSLATPYCAYLLGEGLHTSGVLATVVCGLYLGRRGSKNVTSEARLDLQAVWKTIEFVLNGVVFILIGLQLPAVLSGMYEYSWPQLIAAAAFISLLLIALRMIWVFPGAHFAWFIRHRLLKQKEAGSTNRQLIVLGWSGLRGVLTLAAALSLPETTDSGEPFPHRSMILFLAFAAILVTLVGQGLTLPWLTRRLGVCAGTDLSDEERAGRRALLTAALEQLDGLKQERAAGTAEPVTADFEAHQRAIVLLEQVYAQRLEALQREEERERSRKNGGVPTDATINSSLAARVRQSEREALFRLRAAGEIGDSTARKLERELDLLDIRFPSA
jgi:CPA1 family monovalent cation:H+ antiporter